MTTISNANVFFQDKFQKGSVSFDGGKVVNVGGAAAQGSVIDAEGKYLIPGFVDIHIHGANGSDFCDGTEEAFVAIAKYLASVGVTSFLGTSMAYDLQTLTDIFRAAASYIKRSPDGRAAMRGINMEGPFFAKSRKGAQSEKYIIDPDIDFFRQLYEASGRFVKLVDVAPELPGATEFIKAASEITLVSLAHTDADYSTAAAALQNGASHITHLFNAMPPFTHREPGVVGAALDYAETVELISDGVHLHPSAVRAAFRLFGKERICLISDAMRACGLSDGEYEFGGQTVFVKGERAILRNGALAGSCTPLSECVRRAISFGIKPEDAVYSATMLPAMRAGIADRAGSIEVGKPADLVLLNSDFSINRVIVDGMFVV